MKHKVQEHLKLTGSGIKLHDYLGTHVWTSNMKYLLTTTKYCYADSDIQSIKNRENMGSNNKITYRSWFHGWGISITANFSAIITILWGLPAATEIWCQTKNFAFTSVLLITILKAMELRPLYLDSSISIRQPIKYAKDKISDNAPALCWALDICSKLHTSPLAYKSPWSTIRKLLPACSYQAKTGRSSSPVLPLNPSLHLPLSS